MKATTILGSLLLSVALCSPGFGMELLGRLLGLTKCDDCAACVPCQSCYKVCSPFKACVPDTPCCGSAACEKPCRLPTVCKKPCCAPVGCKKPCCAPVGCETCDKPGCCSKLRTKAREVLCNIKDLFHCKKCRCDCGCPTCCGEGSYVKAYNGGAAPAKKPATPVKGSPAPAPVPEATPIPPAPTH